MKTIAYILLLLTGCLSAPAREYAMRHYTQADGLPGSSVYDMYQDGTGYLWLATSAGISRYNGIAFENFTTRDGLPDNECFFFRKDPYGRLWIATYSGVLAYFKDGIFHTAKNTPALKLPFTTRSLMDIRVEADSSVSFFYRNTPFVSIKGNKLQVFDLDAAIARYGLGTDFSGRYTQNIVHEQGKIRVTYRKGQLLLNEQLQLLQTKRFGAFVMDWAFSTPEHEYLRSGNLIYNRNLVSAGFPVLPEHSAVFKIRNYDGICFIATDKGLWIDQERIMPEVRFSDVFRDGNGDYWLCTIGDGVYKLRRHFRDIRYFKPADEIAYACPGTDTIILCSRNGDLYRMMPTGLRQLTRFWQATGLTLKDRKHVFYADNRYILHFVKGIMVIYDKTRLQEVLVDRSIYYNGSTKILRNGANLYLINSENTWTLDYQKLLHRAPGLAHALLDSGQTARAGAMYDMAQSSDSAIWIATRNGLYKVTDNHAREQQQLGSMALRAIVFTRHALIGYTPDNRLLVIHGYDSPAPKVSIAGHSDAVWDKFYVLNDSSLIVSSNKLYKMITTSASSYRVHTLEHPLLPQRARYIFSDGRYGYFFKEKYGIGIPLAELMAGPRPPQLHLIDLATRRYTLPISASLSLDYGASRDIRVSFEALSFDAGALSFEYSIAAPGDTAAQWLQAPGDHINFYKISPGTYQIRVRALTASGISSNVPGFTLVIRPPFWLNPWFLMLAGLVLASLLYLGFRLFVRRTEQKRKREMKFMKSELIALNALMNPHFVFNSLNSVQSLVSRNAREEASRYIRIFSDLVRLNMHNLTADRISLEKEMILVTNYLELEKLRFRDGFHYEIIIPEEVETDVIMVPPLLLQPLVENAVKHGLRANGNPKGMIFVEISEEEEVVLITVKDNGPGLRENAPGSRGHQSLALDNVKQRLEKLRQMHGQQITLEVSELKDNEGQVQGVCSALRIGPGFSSDRRKRHSAFGKDY
ncbi:sensor histidine kinase [Taibaiella koreensis]|uniref:sensor histidine kinase n=1 Tax=Taibaiella koreensis TaxID=1268548 RepID=UPI000E59B36D|nr:histidine kinase [Taibaiella koreensis]